MSWRTVIVSSQSKLDYKMGYMVVRGKETRRVLLDEVAILYFNALFGMDFTRGADTSINAALNYGYSLILSAVNREISNNGYLTQLGIFHDNMFNPYNLGSDLMEPFRVLVDRRVRKEMPIEFGKEEKHEMWTILEDTVVINQCHQSVLNAIRIYVHSVFEAINDGDPSEISFFEIE